MLSWMCKSVRIFSTTEFFSFLKSHEGSIPFACSQRNKTHFFGLCWIEHIFSLIRLWTVPHNLCAYAMKPKFWYVKKFHNNLGKGICQLFITHAWISCALWTNIFTRESFSLFWPVYLNDLTSVIRFLVWWCQRLSPI